MDDSLRDLQKDRKSYKKVLYRYLIILSIGINIIGVELVPILNIPTFLNAVGTILAGVLMGPFIGALVGFLTSIILGFFIDPGYFYFTFVSILVGFISGYIFKEYTFNIKTIISASIFISVITAIVGNTISYMALGGVAGDQIDKITQILIEKGVNVFLAVNITGFFANFLDKLLSFAIVFLVIMLMDNKMDMQDFQIRWK
ncbi:MAG: energy-coupling factor transport system substrate-specific component [Methanococcus sp.]|nr:energy-coupling factor transport system substrate-specific component [Methanococcus sp.]